MINFKAYASSSKGNFYTINDGQTKLMIECGLPWKQIQRHLKFQTGDISGCLISHFHADHSKATHDIIGRGIDVYTSQGTFESLSVNSHRTNVVKSGGQFKIGTFTILPFDTRHDAPEPLGYLIVNKDGDKLIFATDTYYVPYRFNGLNIIAIECNYAADILQANVDAGKVPESMRNRLLRSHFSLDNVKKFLLANDLSKVREIWLIHLSDGNSDAERFKREVQELTGKMVIIADA